MDDEDFDPFLAILLKLLMDSAKADTLSLVNVVDTKTGRTERMICAEQTEITDHGVNYLHTPIAILVNPEEMNSNRYMPSDEDMSVGESTVSYEAEDKSIKIVETPPTSKRTN